MEIMDYGELWIFGKETENDSVLGFIYYHIGHNNC